KRSFLITTHVNPEGDAIGSSLALALGLREIGKESALALRDPLPSRLRFLPGSDLYQRAAAIEPDFPAFDAMIVTDCGDLERIGFFRTERPPAPRIINVDHHITNVKFGDLNWIDPDATASGVMVHTLLRRLEVSITPPIATALYTTLLTETGAFRYSNTTGETLRLAGELVEAGADPCRIAEAIYSGNSVGRFRLLGAILDGMEVMDVVEDRRIAWVTVPLALYERTGTTVEDTEDFINYPRSLAGVEAALLFRETEEPGVIKVSLRSNTDLDVSQLAMAFGGGGHRKAAGFSRKGTLDEVKAATLKSVREAVCAPGRPSTV
ncbi:MAG: bifunctional oligoribonuclease/PAP phosphatase NrnA, partial [Nitrospirae bacterium]|nr:bifunctional oligoribonuclease/PAP phosphatase NrnA [Nitrospirota bacterium]